jgi:hypothetical protein
MATLEISNRTINFNNRILNLRTVTSVAKFHGKTPKPFSFGTIGCAGFLLLVALAALGQRESQGVGAIAAICTGAFFLFAIIRNRKPRDFWVLHVETAAASNNLIASRDEQSIDQAVIQITQALESDVTYHSTLHINDSTIVSESVIQNSSVANTTRK